MALILFCFGKFWFWKYMWGSSCQAQWAKILEYTLGWCFWLYCPTGAHCNEWGGETCCFEHWKKLSPELTILHQPSTEKVIRIRDHGGETASLRKYWSGDNWKQEAWWLEAHISSTRRVFCFDEHFAVTGFLPPTDAEVLPEFDHLYYTLSLSKLFPVLSRTHSLGLSLVCLAWSFGRIRARKVVIDPGDQAQACVCSRLCKSGHMTTLLWWSLSHAIWEWYIQELESYLQSPCPKKSWIGQLPWIDMNHCLSLTYLWCIQKDTCGVSINNCL